MWFLNSLISLLFHLLPVNLMDRLGKASLPGSPPAFSIFSRIRPSLFEYYSSRKVLYMFRKCSRLVPAYGRFLKNNNVKTSGIRTGADFDRLVPVTTRDNYIRAFSLTDRCVNGRLPFSGTFEESSGTTGAPTLWIRSKEEEEYNMALSRASLIHLYGFRKRDNIIALNCFMLGGWSGGLRFASFVSSLASVRNIGQDAKKAIACIRELGTSYTFLLAGYPPFITDLIEYGNNLDGFSWKDYSLHVFAGGEGFVEEWREFISSQLKSGALIYSDYGAIDLDVGISVETPFSVALRKLTNNNPVLRKSIFSTGRIPCFVGQCSPQQFYVRERTDPEGLKELVITVMNLKSASPNIKYAIGDEGGIIRFSEISGILEKSGYPVEQIRKDYNIHAVIPFPVLYLFGRKDGTVSVNGAMISKDEIDRAILTEPELVSSIGRFKISAEPDAENHARLNVWFEAKKETLITDSLCAKCSDAVVNSLLNSNECFRNGYISNPSTNGPVVRLIPFGTGVFAGRQGAMKNIYSL